MKGLIDIQAFIRIITIHRMGVGILLGVFCVCFLWVGDSVLLFCKSKKHGGKKLKIYFIYYYIKITCTKYMPSLVKIQPVVKEMSFKAIVDDGRRTKDIQ